MASAFRHAAAALALGQTGIAGKSSWRLLLAGIVLSILPDADSIGFLVGITYKSFWGHREFSHSIVFAVFIAAIVQQLFFNSHSSKGERIRVFIFLFLGCISHAILDAMTTGGLGVAFFSPFDDTRYFFPWRPIKVSPINVHAFFEGKGLAVLKSEAVCAASVILLSWLVRKMKRMSVNKNSHH
ncbi:MAG: metal-dependent hydrolase [Bacteroidota bacterium]